SEIHPDYYRVPVADREALLAEHAAMAAADAASDNDEEDLAVNVRADLAAGTAETIENADSAPAADDDGDEADGGDADGDDADGGEASNSSDAAGDALPLTMSSPRLLGPEIESTAEADPDDQASDNPTDGEDNAQTDPQAAPPTP